MGPARHDPGACSTFQSLATAFGPCNLSSPNAACPAAFPWRRAAKQRERALLSGFEPPMPQVSRKRLPPGPVGPPRPGPVPAQGGADPARSSPRPASQ